LTNPFNYCLPQIEISGIRSAAASGSGFAAGVPAVAASGVVLVAVSIAGIALPVIIRMQVIIQLENPVAVGTKINSWV